MDERPRARELLLACERAAAERRAFGAQPEYLQRPGEVEAAWTKATTAHREWQAELRGAEAGQ